MIAGIGCKAGASAGEIEAAITAALACAGLSTDKLTALATSPAKSDEPGIAAAARAHGLAFVVVAQRDLEAAGERVMTRSARVLTLTGVPSVAEAAALAAAGPASRLIGPRVAVGSATCALAVAGDAT
jgi:cobalt-precorrin 5A hydrolase